MDEKNQVDNLTFYDRFKYFRTNFDPLILNEHNHSETVNINREF